MANQCRRCGKTIPDGLKGKADYPHSCKRKKLVDRVRGK